MAFNRNRFTSWSFTRYSDHAKCPLFAKLKHLDKLPDPRPPGPALEHGRDVSQKSEDFLKRKLKKLPKELLKVKEDYAWFLKQKNLIVEENWGFDVNWNPVRWNDWDNCKLRIKIDVGYVALKPNILVIRDGKTGKYRERENESYMLQLELYAAGGVAQLPTVNAVDVGLMYTDLGFYYPPEDKPQVYTAAEAKALRKTWDKRVKPLFNDTKFPPRPGQHCQWCPYQKSLGGPCKF